MSTRVFPFDVYSERESFNSFSCFYNEETLEKNNIASSEAIFLAMRDPSMNEL
jgi:hypothetical protein